ncbi:unnamed protein product [Pylaiella littoralis]
MEPTKGRAKWLMANPPSAVVMLPRVPYRGNEITTAEAWFIWRRKVDNESAPRKQTLFFSLDGL